MLCECCGKKEGIVAQAPWPVPASTCHCDDCANLESVAYTVWREETPITVSKFNCPFPFLNSNDIENLPESYKKFSLREIKQHIKEILKTKGKIAAVLEES
jgi:hypothetical protein